MRQSPPNLNSAQVAQLYRVLRSAFPTRQDLARMVAFGLDKDLDAIDQSGSLSETVFELINWAAAHNREEALISGALAFNSGNRELQAFANSVGLTPPPDAGPFQIEPIWKGELSRIYGFRADLKQPLKALPAADAARDLLLIYDYRAALKKLTDELIQTDARTLKSGPSLQEISERLRRIVDALDGLQYTPVGQQSHVAAALRELNLAFNALTLTVDLAKVEDVERGLLFYDNLQLCLKSIDYAIKKLSLD